MVSDRRRTRALRWLLAGAAAMLGALAGLVATAVPASAHPLGNFTTNVYGGLVVQAERVLVDYVVDLAEIPTVRARNDVDRLGEKQWAAGECDRLARGVKVHDGDRAPATTVRSSALAFGDGAGGLSVLRLSCGMAAARQGGATRVEVRYEDTNFAGRVGWREVTANGDGTTLSVSDVPVDSTSDRLTSYPEDLLSSPLRVSSARLEVTPGGPRLDGAESAGSEAPRAGGVSIAGDQLTRRFTALVGRQNVDAPFVLLAIVLATLLGAVHAFAPGHGKTVMAAYLVGQRGTTRQALLIGVTVTATHTFGVLVLGLLLSASSILAPERIYPWLTVASGVLFASIGIRLLVGALRQRRAARQRDDGHDQAHEHGFDHAHEHGPALADEHGPARADEHGSAHAHEHQVAHAHEFAHAGDSGHGLHERAPAQAHDHAGGHAHDPAGGHAHDPAGGHAHDPAGGHAHDHAGGHAHDPAGGHAHDPAGGHAHDPAGGHAHDPAGGHAHDHAGGHAHDPAGGHAHDPAGGHAHDPAGGHAHDPAGGHAHDPAGGHAHDPAGGHAHDPAGGHAHDHAGGHAHDPAGGHAHDHAGGHAHDHAGGHAHDHAGGHAHDHAGGHPHDHAEAHDHSADPVARRELEHSHGGLAHRHALPDPDGAPIGWRSLFVLGLAGGMVPTPSALIVLLGAIALGRAWLGVGLVLAYGAGMAAALTGTGLLLLRARGMIEARTARWRHKGVVVVVGRVVPLATAGLIILAGSAVVAKGAAGL